MNDQPNETDHQNPPANRHNPKETAMKTATKTHTGTKKTHKASNKPAGNAGTSKEIQMQTEIYLADFGAKTTKRYILTRKPRQNPTAEQLAFDAAMAEILDLPSTGEQCDRYNPKTKSGEPLSLYCVSDPGPSGLSGPDEVFDSGFTVGFEVGFEGGWNTALKYARKCAITK
jgi:hypothetical protein